MRSARGARTPSAWASAHLRPARAAGLRLGLSHEFLGRARRLARRCSSAYGLPQTPRGLDHGLAYEALAAGEIDVIDLYSTDAKIERYGIARARGRPRLLPALRRGAAVSGRRAGALSGRVRGAAEAGRPHRRRHHGPAERARRDRQAGVRRRGARVSGQRADWRRQRSGLGPALFAPGLRAPARASTWRWCSPRSRRPC